ncbi:CTQ-dependent glycine oxidase GoxA [Roseibium sediminicola]|uniref:CTQ-dependent glycine oxidase GoxA n=1 Tax=Roseibium sediminicola TaxID=2933272 RepID=A0ABT0GS47_9HYPH|nr:CTQ-dependent glycine oxidase GoxA [Roseibium sp. CAU 1639]MCK7612258.1 CTQ-dependent glycine oxidase GoxA [Roseibium sp. CAU 1639]
MKRRDFLSSVGVGLGLSVANLPFLPKLALASAPKLEAADPDAEIARVGIYPAIGICRVGGSQKWFYAPELPGVPANPEGGFKDGTSKIKKQVQRFRVFAFDSEGRVISELTEKTARIVWRVHLANTKAAWYGFNNPLDNGQSAPGLPTQKRNQFLQSQEKRERMLVIDPGPVTISGARENWEGDRPEYGMTGRFWQSVDVSLGQLRTDEAGRLLVVPPDGVSASPRGAEITSFADNDGWYDDWCDGPVDATVTLPDGRTLTADGSWVACVGPNFAPEIPPISSLYDVIESMNWEQGWIADPEKPVSFRRDVYPTFRRAALMEWVSAAANLRKGWLDIGDFSDPDYLKQLADPSDANAAFRQSVLENFRDPSDHSPTAFIDQHLKIPLMPGDGVNFNSSPLTWFQFPQLQYEMLNSWAAGDFVNDFEDPSLDDIRDLDDLPVEARPHALTEAALEPCSGGAFHPGVELSYYLRLAPLYQRHTDQGAEPFRIARGNRPSLVQDLGLLLDFGAATSGDTPAIGPQMPGDLTRWMGLPWQPDAFSCQRVAMQDDFPVPVWWPALLPVDVLPEHSYEQAMREDLSAEERLKFFNNREWWARGVPGIGYHANASYWDGIQNMIRIWQEMGFVVSRPGPAEGQSVSGIPETVFVEVDRGNTENRYDWQPSDGQLP